MKMGKGILGRGVDRSRDGEYSGLSSVLSPWIWDVECVIPVRWYLEGRFGGIPVVWVSSCQ